MPKTVSTGPVAPDAITHLRPVPGHLSFSQITTLASRYKHHCSRRWAYSKLMGLDDDDVVSYLLVVGKVIDNASQDYLAARMWNEYTQGRTAGDPEQAYWGQIAESAFNSICGEDKWAQWPDLNKLDQYLVTTALAAHAMFDYLQTIPTPQAVQTKHTWHLNSATRAGEVVTVIGYSDWVDFEGVIVDAKLRGKNPVNKEGEWEEGWVAPIRAQVAGYWLARSIYARKMNLPEPPRVGRIVVVTAANNLKTAHVQVLDFPISTEDINDLIEDTQEAYAKQHADTHPPSPGDACTFCSFRVRCAWDSERFSPLTTQLVEVPTGA